jgi:hypothetical protein
MAGDPRGGADVVGQGDGDAPAGKLRGLRAAVVAAAVLIGVGAVSKSGLLSSDEPAPTATPTASASAAAAGAPRLVARVGDTLLVGGIPAIETGSALPDFGPEARLVPAMAGADTAQPLIGVAGRTLFRSDPARGRWRPLGHAEAVVAAGVRPSRVYVFRHGRLVEAEIATGTTTDRQPFPGFDASQWRAKGLITAAEGDSALVMSHRVAEGREDLALAWSATSVDSLGRPEVQALGTYGPVVGVAADRVITLRACPGPDCRIVIVSRTTDLVLARAVAPPRGFTFVGATRQRAAGQMQESLVTVERLTGGSPDRHFALARLVPGGDSALLVRGTESVHLPAGLVAGPRGQVYLLIRPSDGTLPQARVWDPDRPYVVSALTPQVTFPTDAKLVCVCG